MKLAHIVAMFALFSAYALAQARETPQATQPTTRAQSPANAAGQKTPADAPDPNALRAAQLMLSDIAKAYKSAKTLSDSIQRDIEMPDGAQNDVVTVMFGQGNDAYMEIEGTIIAALGDKLTVIRGDVDDRYVSAKLEGGVLRTLNRVAESEDFIPPLFGLRFSDKPEEQLASLTLGVLNNIKLIRNDVVKNEIGGVDPIIYFSADNGKGSVQFDPRSKLVKVVRMEIKPEDAAEDMDQKISIKLTMSPEVRDELPAPIAVDPGERKAVSSMADLDPGLIPGDEAPNFTLQTLQGEKVELSALKGSVVVLDFWATWCGPCKQALPQVQEFATWAAASKQPIKVFAVDVWERDETPDQKKSSVQEFWKQKGYAMPVLLDLDDAAVAKFGYQSIPTTVIVGPDGKVAAVHRGFDPNSSITEKLKADALKALKPPS